MGDVPITIENDVPIKFVNGNEFLLKHKKKICTEADKLLKEVLPTRIATLDTLRKNPRFSWENIQRVRECAVSGDKIVVNAYLQECITQLKPYMQEFIDHCFVLRTWITLLVPKSEDGDNLGVQVQYEVVNECDSNAISIKNCYAAFNIHYLERAKSISKLQKYPGDSSSCIKHSIQEYDEVVFMQLKCIAGKLYFYYLSMYDTIMKNIDKIQKPRNDSHELYFTG